MREAANLLANALRKKLGNGILGPQTPLIAKVKNQYLVDIWIKINKDAEQKRLATKQVVTQESKRVLRNKTFKQLKILFDVDPI